MRTHAITAACVALAVALVPAGARAADAPATLAIDGVGTALVAPDVATLSIGVKSTAATRQGARLQRYWRDIAMVRTHRAAQYESGAQEFGRLYLAP